MKKSTLVSWAMFFVLLFLSVNFSKAGNVEQRSLSTPLSRLVGHWRISNEDEDMEYYFSQAEKKADKMIGNYVEVYSNDPKNKDLAGKAFFLEYEVLSQDMNGEELEIIMEDAENKGDESYAKTCKLYISKNGKQFRYTMITDFGVAERTEPFLYVDSQTSYDAVPQDAETLLDQEIDLRDQAGDPIEGTYIDQSDRNKIWVITKLADGQYQAKIQNASPGGHVFNTLVGRYSNGLWEGKITATGGTFDGWESATFRLNFSQDLKTISGAFTFWNNWSAYNYALAAAKVDDGAVATMSKPSTAVAKIPKTSTWSYVPANYNKEKIYNGTMTIKVNGEEVTGTWKASHGNATYSGLLDSTSDKNYYVVNGNYDRTLFSRWKTSAWNFKGPFQWKILKKNWSTLIGNDNKDYPSAKIGAKRTK